MAAKHTPTPWMIDNVSGYGFCMKSDGRLVGQVSSYNGRLQNEANAAFIVRAVNAHDDLVAALKEARAELEAYELEATGEFYNSLSLNAALAKAEA